MTDLEQREPDESDTLVEELERIAKDDEDGLVRPEAVVEAARDEESPLHRFFEWDNDEAAEQYRLYQARKLIVRVTVKVAASAGPTYVNVKITHPATGQVRQGYVPMARAAADPDLYGQIVEDARKGIIGYRNRLSAFEEAHEIVGRLDVALESMKSTED